MQDSVVMMKSWQTRRQASLLPQPRVLLLEDNDLLRESFATPLRQHGYQVIEARRARDMGPALGGTPPDVIIVEETLPDGVGVEVIRRARARGDPAQIIYLAQHAPSPRSYLELTRDLGVARVVSMPVAPLDLLAQVGALVAPPDADTGEESPTSSVSPPPTSRETPPSSLPKPPPRIPEATVSARRTAAAPTEVIERPEILVVGGDPGFRGEVVRLAEERLTRAVDCPDAAAAVAYAQTHTVKGALIDARLPGTNAFALGRELVRVATPPPLLAFVSDKPTVGEQLAAVQAGACLFLESPLSRHDLGEVMDAFVQPDVSPQPQILIVDADPRAAQAMATLLRDHGHCVDIASATPEVFSALERTRPDLLLLDAEMPGIGGDAVCRMIRARVRWRDTPVIFTSRFASLATKLAAFEAGADDFILRSTEVTEILARVQVCIARSRRQRARLSHDYLTGMLNRQTFLERLGPLLADAARREAPVSFCVLDIDRFKNVNDTFGHAAGDRVLVRLGRLIASHLRASDLCARWGGEEFALALGDSTPEQARQTVERLQHAFSKLDFRGDRGALFHVGFSAGISTYPREGTSIDPLMRLADQRMYAAKGAKKSRIRHPTLSAPPPRRRPTRPPR